MGRVVNAHHFGLYERSILALIDDAGTYVDFHFENIESQCPNCLWDFVHKSSSGRYNGKGPKPFTQGICPVCKGKGRTTQDKVFQIKCLVNWIAGMKRLSTSGGNMEKAECSIKAPISARDIIKTAKYVVIDGIRMKAEPGLPRGLGGEVVCEAVCKEDK